MTIRIRRSAGGPVVLGGGSQAEPMIEPAAGAEVREPLAMPAVAAAPPRRAAAAGRKASRPRAEKVPARSKPKSPAVPPKQRSRKATSASPAKPAKPTTPRGTRKPAPSKPGSKTARSKSKRDAQPDLFAAPASKPAPAPVAATPKKKRAPKPAPQPEPTAAPEPAVEGATADNERAAAPTRRRATAESMAQKQREISVSEFFMKNRHLLGFDSPARALLTTVKEAFDNSLDACEEAGILPTVRVELIEITEDRYRAVVEDNGPGIVKAQIPKIFGKLLYGSKFHRLRQARGQQGIGISAAGMYGQLTTGKPVVITSKTGKGRPAHHFEIVIDTARNTPNIVKDETVPWDREHGTRVEIELEGTYKAGRRSVDEYIEQAAIANPHVEIHYMPPKGRAPLHVPRATTELPREPLEIKPHPYGVELGMLQKILQDTESRTLSAALHHEFSRVTPKVAEEILAKAMLSPRAKPGQLKPGEIERLHKVIPQVKIFAPPTACVVPIGEDLIRKGLEREIQAEFYTSATRPPSVYRGNPFQVEAGLAYGGSLRGGSSDDDDVHTTAREADAQQGPITLLRLANRVPLQYQQSSCAAFKGVVDTNWRSYGLVQPRGSLPQGPMVLMVHIASVWVPFTSESKEAVAHYPEILREIQLALQECGRRLGSYLRRREAERHEARRRSIFEMYIGELVESLGKLTPVDRQKLQKELLAQARKHTGDSDEDIAAMLESTRKVVEREGESGDEGNGVDGETASGKPTRGRKHQPVTRGKSTPAAAAPGAAPGRSRSKSKRKSLQLELLNDEEVAS